MKKKLMTIMMLLVLVFTLASCDFLSTIEAYKGFYTDYQDYSARYDEATNYTVLTETEFTISDATAEGLNDISSRVYVMLDETSPFLYVEQTLDGISETSLYEDGEDLYVEYIIDGNVATPTIPADGERYDGSNSANIFNENFNYEDVQNEKKTVDHTYEMDVYLNQVINLDELTDFISQVEVFGGSLSSFDNALAHVVVTFTDQDSVIDLSIAVTDYTITFEDQTYVTLSLTNHTVLSIPEDFEMPNVLADPYQLVAVDDIRLARRVYTPGEVITYPALSGQPGWVQVSLQAGISLFTIETDGTIPYTYTLYDSEQNPVDLTPTMYDNTKSIELTEAGTYYLYISPLADVQIDIAVLDENNPINVTTTTTEAVATTTTSSTAD